MSTPTFSIASLLGSVALCLTACNNAENETPAPASSTTTTVISGVVQAQNEVLQPISKAGATVVLEGTAIKAITDADGAYQLREVPVGKHVLSVSRAGMGTMRFEADVKTLAPVAFPVVQLDQESTTQVTNLQAVGRSTYSLPSEVAAFQSTITYNPDLYPAPKMFAMSVYLGKTNSVSNTDYVAQTRHGQSESTPAPVVRGTANMRIAFHDSELRQLGFVSGDKVYVVAYGAPVNVADGGIGREAYYFKPYAFDPATNRIERVVANLNGSPVKTSFTMP